MTRLLAASLVAAATMLLAAAPARAQGYNDEGIGFGIEGGIVRATIETDNAEDFLDQRTGLMGGIWFGGNRNGTLGFMGEIAYVVKGASQAGTDSGAEDIKLHYLEIPALVRINLGQTKQKNGFIVYPMIGPVIDIKLQDNLKSLDIAEQFNGYDFGIIGGVGVEVARIGIEARMNWGLKSLVSNDGEFGDVVDAKNKSFEFLVKIRLN